MESKWISVKDKLPPIDKRVVIYNEGKKETGLGYIDKYNEDNVSKKHIYPNWNIYGGYGLSKITHWMPLPEPPKN